MRRSFLFKLIFALLLGRTDEIQDIGRFRQIPVFADETDKTILDQLLEVNKYDARHRPDNQTVVTVAIQLFSVASPDESSLNYEVEFLLYLRWRDYRLEFNDGGRHRYLKALTHANRMWIPDIYFIKHGELKQPLVNMSLKVFSNGTVLHITKRSMVINCQGNLQIFPFDNPKCPFAFESISHEMTELELEWTDKTLPLERATSFQHHNAYLVKNETGKCDVHHTWRGNFSCLRVLLVFTRDKSFYFSTVFGPGMVLVSSSFISFWLDINVVPARVMIGVTTMLNFCTTTNNFRSKLPVVSNLTAMNLWDSMCMFFIYASLIEFIIGNYMHRKHPHRARPTTEIQRRPTAATSRRSQYTSGDALVMQPMIPTGDMAAGARPTDARSEPATTPDVEADCLPPQNEADATSPQGTKFGVQGATYRAPDSTTSRYTTSTGPFADCVVILRHKVKSLDSIAKLVFPIVFGIFISCFFLTYAIIKPQQSENWELIGGD